MAEPWNDSLSEDWISERAPSSPSNSAGNRSNLDLGSINSQSRIPHLRASLRKESVNGSFLKPRSTRGIARSKTAPVLAERSPSSLNVPAQQANGSEKRAGASTIPRRASSVFSESQASVQHYSLRQSARAHDNNTPDWKRRLARGEDVAADGVDLFSPSKLEGIFSEPRSKENVRREAAPPLNQQNPWSFLNLPKVSVPYEQPPTFRTSRGIMPVMEPVEEVNEDQSSAYGLPEPDNELGKKESIRGLVSKRVDSLERAHGPTSTEISTQRKQSKSEVHDPRVRTISGQEEIHNEEISPITISKQNTIRDRALQNSSHMDANDLGKRLRVLNMDESRRPSSSSSDAGIQYGQRQENGRSAPREESNLELTTHSLPEDLSMGTQEFVYHGGFVNNRRGGYDSNDSFQQKELSSVASSHPQSRRPSFLPSNIRSSPPPYAAQKRDVEDTRLSTSLPISPSSESVVRRTEASSRPLSSGSPLKLFGNRDTYTNNKLLRMISQFEDADEVAEKDQAVGSILQTQQEVNFRMSQFGNGTLDRFDFAQTAERHKLVEELSEIEIHTADRIFKPADGSPDLRPSKHALAPRPSQLPRPVAPTPTVQQRPSDEENGKGAPDSPRKDRTPKRRRTLLRDEIQITDYAHVGKIELTADSTRLAGTKHKDSRPETVDSPIDPEVLATRAMLRPRIARRKSSISAKQALDEVKATGDPPAAPGADTAITEALAAELASFANDAQQAANDSRKPSLATKDYMEEANKVMQFIRAKGKPKTNMPSIDEPSEISELNPDAILDLDVESESTIEDFSRPPSREGPRAQRPKTRNAEVDPRTASHLRKFKDPEDLELLASTSVIGTWPGVDNKQAIEAALVPVPDEEQESSPPNMRILNHDDTQRKRKHSTSSLERPISSGHDANQQTQGSSDSSTGRTFPTNSSNSTGQRGMITSGTVMIPDQVGTMTFDRAKNIWVRGRKINEDVTPKARHERQTTSEEDPFANIPDLSIDEHREEVVKTGSQKSQDGDVRGTSATEPQTHQDLQHKFDSINSQQSTYGDRLHGLLQPPPGTSTTSTDKQDSMRSRLSDYELNVLNGVPSCSPQGTENVRKQPRVVTIAFSSPLVSAIQYPEELSHSEVDLDELDDLPLDDSVMSASTPVSTRADQWAKKVRKTKAAQEPLNVPTSRHEQYRAMTLNRRPVSRIEEHDENEEVNIEMSLVHVRDPSAITPAPRHNESALVPRTGPRNSSLIALTPLSEFSVHQVDHAGDPERSYIATRVQSNSLRQAHGTLALAVDDLVKAITDAEQSELFWEQERRLDLAAKGLTTLHGLKDYCTGLEALDIHDNKISELGGLPKSIRVLNVQSNLLSGLTSWGHLRNLQYVNVSGNELDSLDGFGALVHLRTLDASDNQINNIDGVFGLDALLSLNLAGNQLTAINFQDAELTRLTTLDLGRNRLTDVRNLHVLPSLKELNVSQNELSAFFAPEGISFRNLGVLNASENKLETIDLSSFLGLEILDLDCNSINKISGLQDARSLRSLSLREQTDAPDIANLVLSTPNECQEIYLSSNLVSACQLNLPQAPQYNLRHLELACCGISVIPERFGDSFPNVRALNLNFNGVRNIEGLRGMVNMEKLQVVGNRIHRLRRTCLLLVKLGPNLREVDLRENSLTVGFYAPSSGTMETGNPFELSRQDSKRDGKWRCLMDETTGLKRRMVELLLGQGCLQLATLNGLDFDRGQVRMDDRVWDRLTGLGVFQKTIMPPPNAGEVVNEVEVEEELPTGIDGDRGRCHGGEEFGE